MPLPNQDREAVALRQHFENVRRAELERLGYKMAALPPDARDTARAVLDEITHLMMEKLLLTPTEQLKSLSDTETVGTYTEALTRLFGLGDREAHLEGERTPGKIEPFTRSKQRGSR